MDRPLDALPEGTKLAGYVIGRVLGRGGFGITYFATDALYPDLRVAVKEFLPAGLATRQAGELSVHPTSPGRGDPFKRALASFEKEARTLVALRHPNVVEAQRYIELNGTAYVVMKYEDGKSLAEIVADSGTLDEGEILEILPALLDGLEAVHAKKYLHRDLKPGNIYLRVADGSPVLLDFGAARQAIGDERKTSLSEIYTPGYAPLEQYDRHAVQGPFTDIYALGATLYRCMTGQPPPEAITRHNALRRGAADPLPPIQAAANHRYGPLLCEGVRRSLALEERERPQSIAELRAIFDLQTRAKGVAPPAPQVGRSAAPPERTPLVAAQAHPHRVAPAPKDTQASDKVSTRPPPARAARRGWMVAGALVVVAGGAAAYMALPSAKRESVTTRPTAPTTAHGRVFRDCPECPEMVVIPAGSFTMGSPSTEAGRSDDEGPQRRVAIAKPFALGKYEVTFAEWDACVSAGGCTHQPGDKGWGRGRHPVINVSWEDAKQYVAWLSRRTGKAYRLPSEAEWEYAARAGTTTPFSTGATISSGQANYDGVEVYGSGQRGIRRLETVPVGTFAPNGFGLHDMHGNVWEWVEDCWNGSYAGAPGDGRAWLSGECLRRVWRGGGWDDNPEALRSAARNAKGDRGRRDDSLGFRVAWDLESTSASTSPPVPTPVAPAPRPSPPAAPLQPGRVFRDCPECPEMVEIRAGSFTIGSPPGEEGRMNDEGPQRRITIAKPFALGRYEVTFAEWDACKADGGCSDKPDDNGWGRGRQPVMRVTWNDARAFAAWLSRKTGKGYRLPSEAEWEYAARAGTTGRYPWGDAIGKNNANCKDCGSQWDGKQTAPVGSFAPNAFGLHDMHGNVWEWVEDCWSDSYASTPTDGSVRLSVPCPRGVNRGGSWNDDSNWLRSASRTGFNIGITGTPLGFRLARTLD